MTAVRKILAAALGALALAFACLAALVAPGSAEKWLEPPDEWLRPRPKTRTR